LRPWSGAAAGGSLPPAPSDSTTILPTPPERGAAGAAPAGNRPGPIPGASLTGTTLGGFAIRRFLGRGASGEVYLAEQISLERTVALKVLDSRQAHDPQYLLRFRREARAAARLAHPNTVQVYEVGEAGGRHYIALEYVAGRSLDEVLRTRGRLPWRTALEIARQAAGSLEAAHRMGVVHRDIKPANVLLSDRAVVKLTDFGLARLHGAPGITTQSEVLGTPYYMSPEQARGEPAGPRADLYALGATLYHLLTGRPPFEAPDPMEVLQKHLEELPRPPRELVPGLPREVSQLVLQLLEKSPGKRPASAGAVRSRLAFLGKMAIRPEDVLDAATGTEGTAGPGTSTACRPAPEAAAGRARFDPEEMRELLAFEATRLCILPHPRRAFLEGTMRNYRIPPEQMQYFFEKPLMTRDDVWQLQLVKRAAQGQARAVGIVRKLMELERATGLPLQAVELARHS
jgi:predicted Ser/Thr protein kinase